MGERLREELRQARHEGRVHGAYLITGPAGSGADELALWLAQLLLCRRAGPDPCGRCRDCQKTTSRPAQHPDLHVVQPDGAQIKVEQVRALQRSLGLVANEGGRRVGLILSAETLRIEAANAFLKTLEEPPPRTTLILVAEGSGRLPTTVLSRVTRLRLAPTPEEEIRRALIERGLAPQDAWLAAALGGGSREAAETWAEANLPAARELLAALEALPQAPASTALDLAERFRGSGARDQVGLLLGVYAALARREAERALHEHAPATLSRWLDRAEAAERARAELDRRNLNAQLLIEGLLLDLLPGAA
ncbi:MAG: DNA polymerase III subunit delta' [Myxococcota bacterium]